MIFDSFSRPGLALFLPGYVLTEGSHLAKLGRVVVIKRVDAYPRVELLNVVRSLRAQVIDFVMILEGHIVTRYGIGVIRIIDGVTILFITLEQSGQIETKIRSQSGSCASLDFCAFQPFNRI